MFLLCPLVEAMEVKSLNYRPSKFSTKMGFRDHLVHPLYLIQMEIEARKSELTFSLKHLGGSVSWLSSSCSFLAYDYITSIWLQAYDLCLALVHTLRETSRVKG